MGAIYVIQGILIYIYAFDHNPPHLHVRSGDGEFTITIKDRLVEGVARSKTIKLINEFIDMHENEIMSIWEKAQRRLRYQMGQVLLPLRLKGVSKTRQYPLYLVLVTLCFSVSLAVLLARAIRSVVSTTVEA